MRRNTITLRQLTPGDRKHVRTLFEGLDTHDRMMRFLQPMPRMPDRHIARLSSMDGIGHVAVGAFDGERCVGIARYIRLRNTPGRAEMAVTVASDCRRRGLARRMLGWLEWHADQSGVSEFEVTIAGVNAPAAALARSLGFTLRVQSGELTGVRPVERVGTKRPVEVAPA